MITIVNATTPNTVATTTLDRADALKEMGLFAGTNKGYELEALPTRTQAIVFLLRMLGEEKNAQNNNYTCPFTDVPDWAYISISYAYNKGYTAGISKTAFGADELTTPAQFVTFMLRALGYSDKDGDFVWNESVQKAEELGILPVGKYINKEPFTRGDCVDIIYSILGAKKKDSDVTLVETLIDKGAIDKKIAAKYGFAEIQEVETIKIPITSDENGRYILNARDVIKAFPNAISVVYKWDDKPFVNDYSDAYFIDAYEELKSPNNFYKDLDFNRIVNPPEVDDRAMYYVSVCDKDANMIAASICTVGEAKKKSYLEFIEIFVRGKDHVSNYYKKFDELFGNPVEYKDAIFALERAIINWIEISRKTGKINKVMAKADGTDVPYYRYVINKTKYPKLAEQTVYLGDSDIPSGETASETLKGNCLFVYKYSIDFDGTFGGGYLSNEFTNYSNDWATIASEWNKPRLVVFSDKDKNIIGYTSIVPSQLKIIDVGVVDQTVYID
jgi:hypothetical protein